MFLVAVLFLEVMSVTLISLPAKSTAANELSEVMAGHIINFKFAWKKSNNVFYFYLGR